MLNSSLSNHPVWEIIYFKNSWSSCAPLLYPNFFPTPDPKVITILYLVFIACKDDFFR